MRVGANIQPVTGTLRCILLFLHHTAYYKYDTLISAASEAYF